jgi:MFS family permease
MHAILSVFSLLLGVAVILAGNGLLGTLLGVRGQLEAMSAGVLGLVMAAYFAGFMLGTFWIPRLIRRIGHIRVFATMASMASVVTLLHGLYVDAALWFVLRIVSGICVVGLYISIESWLNAQTSNEQRGHVFSAYMTTTLVGLGIGQLLLITGDARQLELFALASVLLSLGLVPVATTRVIEPVLPEAQRLGLRRLYAISPLGVVGCVFSGLGAGSFWGLGPVFASAVGLGKDGVAAFMSLTILGGILMMWPVGRLSDRFERRRVLTAVCALAATGAALTAVLVELDSKFVMLGGLCYGAFGFSIYALSAAHTNDQLESEHMLEVTSSLQLLWAAGAIVGPIVAGFLMQRFGPEALMMFMASSALVPALFAVWRMRVRDSIPVAEQGEFVPQFATSPAVLEMLPDAEAADQDDPLPGDDLDLPMNADAEVEEDAEDADRTSRADGST